MSGFTEGNISSAITSVYNFAVTYPFITFLIVIVISAVVVMLFKGDITLKIGGKHQDLKEGDAYMDSTYDGTKKKKKSSN